MITARYGSQFFKEKSNGCLTRMKVLDCALYGVKLTTKKWECWEFGQNLKSACQTCCLED